jgi:hypothetical protein
VPLWPTSSAHLVHTKGPAAGRPFELEEWQRAFVDEFYKRDSEGRRVYHLAVLGVPRGNGKSPLAAGLGLYELLTRRDSPDVFCAAGSREQARIVFNFAKSFVETGPLLDVVKVGRNELIYPDGTGSMRVVSAEGSLQFGHSVNRPFRLRVPFSEPLRCSGTWVRPRTRRQEITRANVRGRITAGHEGAFAAYRHAGALPWEPWRAPEPEPLEAGSVDAGRSGSRTRASPALRATTFVRLLVDRGGHWPSSSPA